MNSRASIPQTCFITILVIFKITARIYWDWFQFSMKILSSLFGRETIKEIDPYVKDLENRECRQFLWYFLSIKWEFLDKTEISLATEINSRSLRIFKVPNSNLYTLLEFVKPFGSWISTKASRGHKKSRRWLNLNTSFMKAVVNGTCFKVFELIWLPFSSNSVAL